MEEIDKIFVQNLLNSIYMELQGIDEEDLTKSEKKIKRLVDNAQEHLDKFS